MEVATQSHLFSAAHSRFTVSMPDKPASMKLDKNPKVNEVLYITLRAKDRYGNRFDDSENLAAVHINQSIAVKVQVIHATNGTLLSDDVCESAGCKLTYDPKERIQRAVVKLPYNGTYTLKVTADGDEVKPNEVEQGKLHVASIVCELKDGKLPGRPALPAGEDFGTGVFASSTGDKCLFRSCKPGFGLKSDKSACTACEPGKGPNADSLCEQCVVGQYSSTLEPGICKQCADGEITASDQSECNACDVGKEPNSNSTQCELCAAGKYSKQGICQTCPEGSVAPRGYENCTVCDGRNGQLPSDDGSRCICRAGYYTLPGDTDKCLPCGGSLGLESTKFSDGSSILHSIVPEQRYLDSRPRWDSEEVCSGGDKHGVDASAFICPPKRTVVQIQRNVCSIAPMRRPASVPVNS
eukprot:COSAG05_NODE_3705_length_1893_cov_159.411145_2_plen_411_part_00